MATKTLEQYTAEISKSSANARNALQNQINAIAGNLEQTQKQINENYANQQNTLNNQRNAAASAASLASAANGTAFSGAANIANKKYYEQSFVPAQTQLNTNQSQALENAQTQANNNKLSLESQLASLIDQDNRLAWQAYNEALEREKERQHQLKVARASSSGYGNYYPTSGGTTQQDKYGYNYTDNGGYQFKNNATGAAVKLGTYIQQYGGNFDSRARQMLRSMADNGDYNAQVVLATLNKNPKMKLSANTGKNYKSNGSGYVNNAFNILGLRYS